MFRKLNKKGRVTLYGIVGALLIVFAFFIYNISFVSAFSGSGSGTEGDPFQITSWAQLAEMNDNKTAHYILMNDLSSSTTGYDTYAGPSADSGAGWVPIGSSSSSFWGTFDGGNHTISDLYINRSSSSYQGLFGNVDGNPVEAYAEIRNIGVLNVNITGKDYVGGLFGDSEYTDVSNCYSTGSVTGEDYVGGLVGRTSLTEILYSYSTASVTGETNIGGFAGQSGVRSIEESYSTGNVSGITYVGGFIGYIGQITISNCYSMGNVTRLSGTSGSIGGFAGYIIVVGSVEYSYSIGDVYYAGADPLDKGFVGEEQEGPPSPSYTANFFEKYNQLTGTGATEKTATLMKDYDTFNDAGWDIVLIENHDGDRATAIWFIDDGNDYPRLWFELEDTCSCPGSGTSWEVNMSDYCVIGDSCDLGTGNLTFVGTGNFTCSAQIDLNNMQYPETDQIIWINSGCIINIG